MDGLSCVVGRSIAGEDCSGGVIPLWYRARGDRDMCRSRYVDAAGQFDRQLKYQDNTKPEQLEYTRSDKQDLL